ncbi:MAG: hypothetical protein A2Y12_05800 [Planctomycetes bacterium GWF2_42_9]|nr:MAG: hypothetical protein A2Y12_05800 [Planctomycetes bacterium GWF2_42_9]
MKARLVKLWEYLTTSYWLIPLIMIVIASTSAVLLVKLDRSTDLEPYRAYFFIFSGGSDSAGRVLSTIAGTVITITSIVFSITVVVLTLASNQFGPRLLRNFMDDKQAQISLGTFISTFIFCLIVLSYVRYGEGKTDFVPRIAVSISLILALISGLMLSFYIHHIALKIQPDMVLHEICQLLEEQIAEEMPSLDSSNEPIQDKAEELNLSKSSAVTMKSSGYIEIIDYDSVFQLASENDLIVRFRFRAGQFAVADQVLADVFGSEVDSKLVNQIRNAAVLSYHRTPVQDLEFSIGQIVEIATRALSPGINDSFTAITCIDRLGQEFGSIAMRPEMKKLLTDDKGKLRVIKHALSFDKLMDAGFSQIRQMSQTNIAVGCRVLESLRNVAEKCDSNDRKKSVLNHANLMNGMLLRNITEEHDRQAVESRHEMIKEIVQSSNSL